MNPDSPPRPEPDTYWTTDHLCRLGAGDSEQIAHLLDTHFSARTRLPAQGEQAVIAPTGHRKTTAMCFDRVWSIPSDDTPESVRVFGDTAFEREFFLSILLVGVLPISAYVLPFHHHRKSPPENVIHWPFFENGESDVAQRIIDDVNERAERLKSSPEFDYDADHFDSALQFQHWFARSAARAFTRQHSIPMIPIYASQQQCRAVYAEGDRTVVYATLSDMEVVDEESLTWEQVLDFRADTAARKAYRQLLHWLDKEMLGKSATYIQDEIAARLEKYEWSLRKHGVKTVLGSISRALDGQYFVGASAVAGSAIIAGYPVLGLLASTGLVVGKVAVSLAEALLEYRDTERGPNSDVAWVYEIKRRFTPSSNQERA